MSENSLCELCGKPLPAGEEMFRTHGYSGPCPAPPRHDLWLGAAQEHAAKLRTALADAGKTTLVETVKAIEEQLARERQRAEGRQCTNS